jgi:hypothetical protein
MPQAREGRSLYRIALFLTIVVAGCATTPPPDERTAAAELQAVMQGDLLLKCRDASCAYDFGTKRKRMHALFVEQSWDQLAITVASVGHPSDVAYFYLGRASEGLQRRQAANRYYDLALRERARLPCEKVFDVCEGLHLVDEIVQGQIRLGRLDAVEQAAVEAQAQAVAEEQRRRIEEEAKKAEEQAARARAAAQAQVAALAERKRRQDEDCSRDVIRMSPFLEAMLKDEVDDSATVKLLETSARQGDPFSQLLLFVVSLNDKKGDLDARRAAMDLAIAGASRAPPIAPPKSCEERADVKKFLQDLEGIRLELTRLQVTLDVSDVILDYPELKGDLRRVKGFYFAVGELEYLYQKQGSMTFVMLDTKGLSRVERKRLLLDCSRGCPVVLDGTVEDVFMNRGIRARFLR